MIRIFLCTFLSSSQQFESFIMHSLSAWCCLPVCLLCAFMFQPFVFAVQAKGNYYSWMNANGDRTFLLFSCRFNGCIRRLLLFAFFKTLFSFLVHFYCLLCCWEAANDEAALALSHLWAWMDHFLLTDMITCICTWLKFPYQESSVNFKQFEKIIQIGIDDVWRWRGKNFNCTPTVRELNVNAEE